MASYRTPTSIKISRTPQSKKLYRKEEQLSKLVRECADAWRAALPHHTNEMLQLSTPPKFSQELLPQVLYDLLESFDSGAAKLAAETYLTRNHEAEVHYANTA